MEEHKDKIIEGKSMDWRLNMVGFMKQGTFGDNTFEKPGFFDIKEGKKWEAHNAKKGIDQNVAKRELLKIILPVLAELKL